MTAMSLLWAHGAPPGSHSWCLYDIYCTHHVHECFFHWRMSFLAARPMFPFFKFPLCYLFFYPQKKGTWVCEKINKVNQFKFWSRMRCVMGKQIRTTAILLWPRVLKSHRKLDVFPFLFFCSCLISHILLEDCVTRMQWLRSQYTFVSAPLPYAESTSHAIPGSGLTINWQ